MLEINLSRSLEARGELSDHPVAKTVATLRDEFPFVTSWTLISTRPCIIYILIATRVKHYYQSMKLSRTPYDSNELLAQMEFLLIRNENYKNVIAHFVARIFPPRLKGIIKWQSVRACLVTPEAVNYSRVLTRGPKCIIKAIWEGSKTRQGARCPPVEAALDNLWYPKTRAEHRATSF